MKEELFQIIQTLIYNSFVIFRKIIVFSNTILGIGANHDLPAMFTRLNYIVSSLPERVFLIIEK